MTRRAVEAAGAGVRLVGWVDGGGAPVLLLHGGPGLSYDYMDGLAAELLGGYAVATYQQRGLAPSSEEGPFAVSDHVADIGLVLDALGWERAVLVGHSWGGHLALAAAVTVPDRLHGVLAVDTWGAVGDGGGQEFEQELMARTPPDDARRIAEIDARGERGEGTVDDALAGLQLLWPAYFARREDAPPMPAIRLGGACYLDTMESATRGLGSLEAALPSIRVPVGFVAGAGSPMPVSASTDVAERIRGSWVDVVPDAGHFVWMDVPGRVRGALDRLTRRYETGS